MIAFDTETTGPCLWHGCLPFFVAGCDQRGGLTWWEWSVDPKSRKIEIPENEYDEVADYLCQDTDYVAHNANFDLVAVRNLLKGKWLLEWGWESLEDSLVAAHCLRNLWPHSLKLLRCIFLGISYRKQNALREATNHARRICRRKDFKEAHGVWQIAEKDHPHWPAIKRAPNAGWWVFDTWLPAAICRLAPEFLPELHRYDDPIFHRWHTVLKDYAIEDVESTLALWLWVLKPALEEEGLWEQYLERRELLQITYEMESYGVPLCPTLPSEIERYTKTQAEEEQLAKDLAEKEINLNSNQQLGKLLFEDLEFQPQGKTPSGQYSVTAQTLEGLEDKAPSRKASRFIEHLLLSRRHGKARDYLESYKNWSISNGQGRAIHVNYNITGTVFTRQSSSNPNLMNVGTGRETEEGLEFNLRSVYGPRPGRIWIDFDYSNLELRLWGYLCGNREIIRCFEEGENVHLLIARELHPDLRNLSDDAAKEDKRYKKTKNGDFAILYGASPAKADATYGVRGAFGRISKRFPEVRSFTNQLHREVMERGYIETLTGYRLYIPKEDPHKAVSGKIQGTAGSIIGRAMIDCYRYCTQNEHLDVHMILQVHDELVFDAPEDFQWASELQELMAVQGDRLGIPTPVGGSLITTNWGEGIPL